MIEWAKTHSVTLRFSAEEKCKFLRKVSAASFFIPDYKLRVTILNNVEAVREVKSDTENKTTYTGGLTHKSYTVTKVNTYSSY